MRRRRAGLIVTFSLVAGALSAVLTSSVLAEGSSRRTSCPNTWCAPQQTSCSEVTNWGCNLSGGCAGAQRCDDT
jgi:hypothetical protein